MSPVTRIRWVLGNLELMVFAPPGQPVVTLLQLVVQPAVVLNTNVTDNSRVYQFRFKAADGVPLGAKDTQNNILNFGGYLPKLMLSTLVFSLLAKLNSLWPCHEASTS